ncbi:MAG: DUF2752 domain-containing protein [Pirellulaceae bacterium]
MSIHAPSEPTRDPADEFVPASYVQLPPSPWLHRVLLVLSLGVLLAAFVLKREGTEEVAIAGLNIVLPPTCGARTLWGIDCPGCGLTRSFISLAQGDLIGSWQVNPGGVFLFGFLLLQIPYRGAQLYRIRRGLREWDLIQPAIWFWIFLALVLLGQWLVRLPW